MGHGADVAPCCWVLLQRATNRLVPGRMHPSESLALEVAAEEGLGGGFLQDWGRRYHWLQQQRRQAEDEPPVQAISAGPVSQHWEQAGLGDVEDAARLTISDAAGVLRSVVALLPGAGEVARLGKRGKDKSRARDS